MGGLQVTLIVVGDVSSAATSVGGPATTWIISVLVYTHETDGRTIIIVN